MFNEANARQEICNIMGRIYNKGMVSSAGGNVSIVNREESYILVTPTHIDKVNLLPEHIVKVNLTNGEIIGGGACSSETINHLSIYHSRKDINAIAHAHPTTAVGMVTAGHLPTTVTSEFVVMIRKLGVVDFYPAGDKTVEELTKALEETDVVLLKHHGVFAVGNSLLNAMTKIEVLEEAAKVAFVAQVFGGMPEIPQDKVIECIKTYAK